MLQKLEIEIKSYKAVLRIVTNHTNVHYDDNEINCENDQFMTMNQVSS